ncbi:MAG: mkl [Rickettsiaceae bacterium]|jgi:phospholipid/cholesterol/gamma-HCH transport system ATP-binding protein|nr:mkl [Rickettsiaceae bacterium]
MKQVKIEVENLTKSFGSKNVLKGVNLAVPERSSLALIGGSGTGKSVLIKNIVGLIQPDEGKIFIDGQECEKLSQPEKFKLMSKCGFLFQGGALFDSLSVYQNIVFYPARSSNLKESELRDLAADKLKAVGLSPDIANQFPAELSGGMQKRVALARAIVSNPEIIFFDEPTTGLDPIMSNVINDLIIQSREDLKATTITITHDMNCVERVATDVAMIYKGEIIWHGPKEDLKSTDNSILQQFISGSTQGPISV